MQKRANNILNYLNTEDREQFISELADSVDISVVDGNTKHLVECLDKWETVAELNAIPGFRDRVWERFKHYNLTGRIQ